MNDRTTHKINAIDSGTTRGGMDFDNEYIILYSYLPKAVLHPADDADPGYGPEISFIAIAPDVGDHGGFTDLAQKELNQWAIDWLDEHYEECIVQAEKDRQPDSDYQHDLRREEH